MAWVAVGTTAVGVVGNYLSNKNAGSAPLPQQMQGPQALGAVNTATGGMTYDPTTGAMNQFNYGFDPTQMGAQYQNQSLYNQFMGLGNQGLTTNIDAQIKQLQQKIDNAKSTATGGTAAAQIPAQFQGLQKFFDEKGNLPDISDPNAIYDGRIATPQAQALLKQFQSDTGGNYGGTGAIGFAKWVKDFNSKSLQPAADSFKQTQSVQQGNAKVNDQQIQDLQNQIDYLNKQKTMYGGDSAVNSNNPLLQFMSNAPGWNDVATTNPNQAAWQQQMSSALGLTNASPQDTLSRFGLGNLANTNSLSDNLNRTNNVALDQMGNQLTGSNRSAQDILADYGVGGDTGNTLRDMLTSGLSGSKFQSVSAPQLDPTGAADLEKTLNYQTDTDFRNQNAARDQQLARRGMDSSSVNELAHSQDSLALANQHAQNALAARNYANGIQNQDFSNQAQAAGANNAAQQNSNSLALQYANSLGNQSLAQGQFASGVKNALFNQGMGALNTYNTGVGQQYGMDSSANAANNQTAMNGAGFANTVQNQLFQQALAALQNNNSMLNQNTQNANLNFQNQSAANNTNYQRNMGMFNTLNGLNQQTFGNNMTQQGMSLQGVGTMLPAQMQYVNMGNQANAANTQMQNAYNMQGYQNGIAQNNALWGGLTNMGGSMMNAYGMGGFGGGGGGGNTGSTANVAFNPNTSATAMEGLPQPRTGGFNFQMPENTTYKQPPSNGSF